jgi:hypothetical protein
MATRMSQVILLGSLLGSVMSCSDYNITNDEQNVQSYGPRPEENDKLSEYVNKKYESILDEDEEHDVTSNSHNAKVYKENLEWNKSLWNNKLENDKNLEDNVSALKDMLGDQNKEMIDYINEGHLGSASIKALSDESFLDKHDDYVKVFDYYESKMTQVYLIKIPGFTLKKAESCPFFNPYVKVFKDKTETKNINIHEYSLGSWYCGDEACSKDNNTLDNKRDILDLNIKYLLSQSWNRPKNNFIISINESAAGLAATDFWSSVIIDKSVNIDPTQLYITYIHTPHKGTKIANLVNKNSYLKNFLGNIPALEQMYGCDNAFKYLDCGSDAIKAHDSKLKTLYGAKVGLFNSYGGSEYDMLVPTESASLSYLGDEDLQIKGMGHLPNRVNFRDKLGFAGLFANSIAKKNIGVSLYDEGFDYKTIYDKLNKSGIYDPIIAKLPTNNC